MGTRAYRRANRVFIRPALVVGLIVGGVCIPCVSGAPDIAEVVDQVSVDSYTDSLENDFYAYDGHDRYEGPTHDLAQQNIRMRFESFGLTTSLDPFVYNNVEYYNVVGVLRGVIRPEEIYIVGAHYDTVAGSPGACDNAASVASVVEAARVLSQYLFEATIVFIAFDQEEPGMMGSGAYADQHAQDDIRSMIALDVMAYRPYLPDQAEYNDVRLYYHSGCPEFVVDVAEALTACGGLTSTIGKNPSRFLSDHVPFDVRGVPAAVVTAYAGPSNFNIHTPFDSLNTAGYIDYNYSVQITRGVVGYLATHAGLATVCRLPDFNADGKVDLKDLALLIDHWGQDDPTFDIAPPPAGDGKVDIEDLNAFMTYYEKENPPVKP